MTNERVPEMNSPIVKPVCVSRLSLSGIRQGISPFPDDGLTARLPEEKLLTGELYACVRQIGCYIVRSAQRVYKISSKGVYSPENESPASNEETEIVRKDIMDAGGFHAHSIFMLELWRDSLRLTHEISARHMDTPGESFTYICRAASARNYSWSEGITEITCEKAGPEIPDEYASLVVRLGWTGSSYSMDTFYRLEPTGKVTEDTVRPF